MFFVPVDPLQHEHVQDVRMLDLLVHSWKLRRETARASNDVEGL
jgi:hypothetical protein